MKVKLFFFIFLLVLPVHLLLAQATPVVTVSKAKILIGESIKISFELKAVERSTKVEWKFPDSLFHFQYISFDTTDTFKKEITVTSWDSGVWNLETISVLVPSNLTGKPQLLKFPAKEIRVEYDTTGSAILNDIKPIIEINDAGEQWVAYTIAAITILSLLLLIYLFIKWKNKKETVALAQSHLSPYDEFKEALNQLKNKSWQTQSEQKEGFTELVFITKRFFERKLHQPYTNYLTDETSIQLQKNISRDDVIHVIQILRLADAVKFAKYTAPVSTCAEILDATDTLLRNLNQQMKEA